MPASIFQIGVELVKSNPVNKFEFVICAVVKPVIPSIEPVPVPTD